MSRSCFILGVVLLSASVSKGQAAPTRPAVPLEPISAILEAFKTHQIVALDEGDHGNEQAHAFRLSLVRDPRFAAVVNDVVVEFGSARYQDLMDRFVRGETVSNEDLRRAWQDTTQPHAVWDRPIYEEFFRAVRSVNVSNPARRQIRVLLGDPPVDWDSVKTVQDLEGFDRDGHAAELIRREVLAKGRRALVIYGGLHLVRRPMALNYEVPASPESQVLLNKIERIPGVRVFTVWTNTTFTDLAKIQADVASWPVPSIALLRGTVPGAVDFGIYFPFGGSRVVLRDGKPIPLPREQWGLGLWRTRSMLFSTWGLLL
jgi:hypothetical protein